MLSPGEKFISLHHSCSLDGERVRISCWNCPFESLLEEGGHDFRLSFQLHLWTADSFFFVFFLLGELRGGRTEMGLALKYLLHKGFPGGRTASVPQVPIIVTDGRSQGHVALPAKQLKQRGITCVFCGGLLPSKRFGHTGSALWVSLGTSQPWEERGAGKTILILPGSVFLSLCCIVAGTRGPPSLWKSESLHRL